VAEKGGQGINWVFFNLGKVNQWLTSLPKKQISPHETTSLFFADI
jgi:hypothetical protein